MTMMPEAACFDRPAENPGAPVALTRIVTCFRQWNMIRHWLRNTELFAARTEWIVVNDCPADTPRPELAAELSQRQVRVLAPECNLGRSAARNWGARHAHGEWIEHIDGDDLPLPVEVSELPPPESADVLQFPARSTRVPLTEIGHWTDFQAAVAPTENWSPLLEALRPFDVRLTATMWRLAFFSGLGGYDGRFEGFEDVHLAFKASRCGARVLRLERPKQVYCQRPERDTLGRLRIEGAGRFLRWLRQNHPEVTPEIVNGWLAKEELYLAVRSGLASLCNLSGWWDYVKWRFF